MTTYVITTGERSGSPRCRGRHMHAGEGHRGRRGRRHHGEGPGMTGFFGRGPRVARGDIRAAIIALLAEQPMHGYQIMGELAERTNGVWRPSPGSIYPTLQLLQDEGVVRSEESDGGRRMFQLTDEGQAAYEQVKDAPSPWEAVAEEGDSSAVELRDLVRHVMVAARQVMLAGEAKQIEQAKTVLRETRRSLYRLLGEEPSGSDPGESPEA